MTIEKETADLALEAMELAQTIAATLKEKSPDLVLAVLADLLALVLASHRGSTDAETHDLRSRLLADHINVVCQLVPANEAQLLAIIRERSH